MSKHSNIAFFIPHMGCSNLCSFCNQRIISGSIEAPSFYEIKLTCKREYNRMTLKQRRNTQIAFFGGSFTAIDRNLMTGYLDCVREFIGNDGFSGIRISTRPDAINDEILHILKEKSVTSIELGAQSMDDYVLRKNLRGHTSYQIEQACKKIFEYDIELGMQIMVGLPGQSKQSVMNTAKKVIDIHPETIRIYPVVIFKGSLIESWYNSGQYVPPSLDEGIELCSKLLELFNNNSIKVIRLGLHAQKTMEKDIVAGLYHPAFKELCESRIYLRKLKFLFKNLQTGSYKILVNSSEVSKVIGHKKSNIKVLKDAGYLVKVIGDKSIDIGELQLI